MLGKLLKYGAVTVAALLAGKVIHKKIKEKQEEKELNQSDAGSIGAGEMPTGATNEAEQASVKAKK